MCKNVMVLNCYVVVVYFVMGWFGLAKLFDSLYVGNLGKSYNTSRLNEMSSMAMFYF